MQNGMSFLSEHIEAPVRGNRATLTLADGSILDPSDDLNGIIIGEEGLSCNDGSLVRIVWLNSATTLNNKPLDAFLNSFIFLHILDLAESFSQNPDHMNFP